MVEHQPLQCRSQGKLVVVVVQPWGETEDVGLVWGETETVQLGASVSNKRNERKTFKCFVLPYPPLCQRKGI
jgi:hypothetical protein